MAGLTWKWYETSRWRLSRVGGRTTPSSLLFSSSSYENQELQNIAEIASEKWKRTQVTEKIEEVDTAKLNRMVWKGGTYFLSTTVKKPKK